MRITFNLQGVGPADNGGTATLFHSANVLHALGHTVYVVSEQANRFSWFDLKGPEYIKTSGLTHMYPDAQVLIATGAFSVQHVLNAPPARGAKFWWIRAHETWAMAEKDVVSLYRQPFLHLIVNSEGLRRHVWKVAGREAALIRPGLDPDVFYSFNANRNWEDRPLVLGAIFCDKPRKRFDWVVEIYEACKARGLDVELHLFGTYDVAEIKRVKFQKYLYKPSANALRFFYNDVDIWLAPSKSEGLHIPPQEAMLCECFMMGANDPLSGMSDYLKHGVTGLAFNYWSEAVNHIEGLYNDPSPMGAIAKAGRREVIGLGTRQQNMQRLVDVLAKGEPVSVLRNRMTALRRRGVIR